MPGTYRYSATFDKPYVEDTSPPPRSPVRFSIGSWQGSNATSGGGEGNDHPVVVAPSTLLPKDVDLASPTSSVVSPEEEPGQNPPLNDTYRHHARSASTDSLDSASCGSVSGSSAASSSGGSGGHSRQVSMEGSEFISSRLSCGKMPVAAAVSHNPLQFVKVGPVPLYKKAEEQIKIAKEKKICREAIKEHEEAWQSNLDSWKNRRRKMSEKSLARLEEMKMLDEQEKHSKTNNSRVKTFSEMMEERAQKPRSYNLAIYVNNSEEDLMSPDNGSNNSSSERINENRTNLKARSSYSVDLENRENDFHNSSFKVLEHETNGVESKVHSKHLRNILSSESNQRQRKNTDGCAASVDDGFAEEEGTTYGLYTGDSGLESFGSSQRVGDLADSSSELSTDSGSVYDRVGTEDEAGSATPLGQLTTGTDLLEEFSSGKRTKSWPSNLEQKDGYIQRSMRIWVNPQQKEKDFGFTIKVDKDGQGGGVAMVDTIKTGSLSHQAGLRKGDEILSVNGDLAPGRSHSSLMFSIKQSVYRGQLDLIISRPESEELNGAENDEESEARCRPRSHVGPAQRRLLNNRSFDDSCPSRSASENGYRARSKSESSRNRCSWLEREKSASLDDEFPVMNEDLADSKHSKRDSDKSKKPPIAPKVAVKKSPPPVPAKPKFNSAMLNGHRDTYIIATSAQTVVSKPSIDSSVVESKQLSELSRSDSNYAVEKSNILDDMVQSESEDAAFHSVTPLLRTLSDGLRDSTESPKFVPKPDNDVCFSDFNESEQDTEKEIDQDICVKEEGIWNQQSNRAYNGESTKRNSQISVVEEQIAKEEVAVDKDNSTDFEIFQNSSDVSFTTSDMSNERYFIPLNPLYQDTDGFNIVYQSHQEEESQKESFDDQERSSSIDDISHSEPFIQCAMNDEKRGSQESIEEVHEVIQRESVVSDRDLYFEIDNPVGSIEAQIDAAISKENYNALQMSGDSNSEGSPFYMDETALASFDEHNMRAQPPSEKPPPPPPMDGESPVDENGVVRRNNTFKRIKKEIWRRRSDFLGIDPADDEIDIDVPPPPDLSEILKSERDLERKNRLFLEEERSNIQYNLGNMDELSLREIEILHKLEKEEKIKSLKVERDDHELVTTESSTLTVKSEDDERIKRLQDERRRMSEERILREEERISMEEDRMFREREEKLRLKEEHAVFDRNSDTGSECKQLIEQNVSIETSSPSTINNKIDVTSNSSITNSVSVPLTSETISATVDIAVKEALRIERDRLRLDQEALQREREEYRRRIELEQERRYASSQSDSSSEKSVSPQREREAVIWASKQPHGFQEDQSDLEFADVVLRNKSNESVDEQELSPSGQPLNKDTLHFLGAAPKARIIQNEQWINHNEKVAKRRSEPSMSRESRYNQNHWLLHEAEMRRISEQNERQRLQQSPDRPASYHNSVPQYKSSSTTNGVTEPPSARREVPFSRIPSTAPRPYQRPAPPPVPQNKPARVVQKEPWNYRSVTAPTNFTPKKDGSPPKQLPSPGEYRNYPVETSTHQRNVTPQTEPEVQPQEQFLSVSGKEKCSHCGEHLGHGGAMIIESLQLCYHMHCFCCCVCGAQLGNGMCGTDVRVRSNKLHCQNCYSNDEAGLKFSQV